MAADDARISDLAALISQSVQTILGEYAAASRPVPSLDAVDLSQTLVNQRTRDAVRTLEAACAQLCATVAPASHTMVNRAFEMINPASLRVALTARVADQLRDGPKPVSELARSAGMDADKLGRVLRSLASKYCFREVTKDVYANNKLSTCLLPEDPTSSLIWLFADEVYTGLSCLADALSDPEWAASLDKDHTAFARAHKQNWFEFTVNDPVCRERHPLAMVGWTKLNGGDGIVAQLFPWDDLPAGSTFCDLGGSVGHVAMALLKAKPHINALVQEMPSVIVQAHEVWVQEFPEATQTARVQFIPIDFMAESPVEGCDIYYLKHVLHDWVDDDCVTILRNVRRAMREGWSKVLIHELIIMDGAPDAGLSNADHAPAPLLPNYGVGAQRKIHQDLNMLSLFNSRERTLDEFIAIGSRAGLKFARVWDGGDTAIVEFEAA
ncbi:S-adenosyl-L-methionine-dependent methyltransferase [Exidia glandulosa HHB12029]|uniref:S-adenosyl-L-methionine-dependent methyltransferase n=1 Tax=Exidia glandulosa HHB12029 TaxID=1314781 RepID=A0A165P4Q8_EXIGL|nr:S-adenosyl-L-methionine-dependent methyltransferase [Exidia glandulosa HHB12029]